MSENKKWNLNNIPFSKETSIWAVNNSTQSWSTAKNRILMRPVKHPINVRVSECFLKQGFGNLNLFTDILDPQINGQKALLPYAKKMFPLSNA